jgi:hypothetical protein
MLKINARISAPASFLLLAMRVPEALQFGSRF